MTTARGVYVVWRSYQRRAETLADELGCDLVFLPHRFKTRWLRPFDYLGSAIATFQLLRRRRPAYAVFQAPPAFVALPALVLGVPYVVDGHNAVFQGRWSRVPGTATILNRATAVLAHNEEVLKIARERFVGAPLTVLRDPLGTLPKGSPSERVRDQVLVIASFGADEPIDALLDTIEYAPDTTFVLTADPAKLPEPQRRRLVSAPNVKLTGFLATEEYQRLLATSGVALVLSDRPATQPSGACEALASDTPLVVSRSTLTERLYGSWAHLVEHEPASIASAIRRAAAGGTDLGHERRGWTDAFGRELSALAERIPVQRRGGA